MYHDNNLKSLFMKVFPIFLLTIFFIKTVKGEDEKIWLPDNANQNVFDEPFDYVSESYLPNLVDSGNFDWISCAGTALPDIKKSYIAFTGTRQNKANNYSSVFTKESGIIVLCESSLVTSQNLNINLNCKTLEERSLAAKTGIFFGSTVRSVMFKNDQALFIYCDPLWIDPKSHFNEPSGKCRLSYIKNNIIEKNKDFPICLPDAKCLGGFSVDIISRNENIELIFGLPFRNSTLYLKQAQSYSVNQASSYEGNFFNFGYAVSFAGDGSVFISSPVSDEKSPFVTQLSGYKFYPQNQKTQNFGGFGTSIDTVHLGKEKYGVVIGAPYQSKQKLPNVGAVFLACKGFTTDMVMGESVDDYFGYAVARIGVLDYEGIDSFAVSAPRLNLKKPGKIYIFKIMSNCKIQKNPIQVYESNIMGFGISISKGFDIDFNGWPDFFVTSLNSTKSSFFKMPSQIPVTCLWTKLNIIDALKKDETFDIPIKFILDDTINFGDYFFQVALDFLNKDEKRFELINSTYSQRSSKLTVKLLMDAVDMDFRTFPLKVALKGTRLCKTSNKIDCIKSNAYNIKWEKCETTINMIQNKCNLPKCLSDLKLTVKPDINGSIIYLGTQKNYIRKLNVVINNLGQQATPRIYLAIKSNPDIMITNANCSVTSKVILTPNGQNTTIIIKDNIDPNTQVNIIVDILYNQLNEIKNESSINFRVWGINDDENMLNNEFKINYTILFKPNLIFSSKKAENTIIDSRLKPPYLESLKKIPVHDLGTELKFAYIIENKGPELKNVEFKFKFPYKTDDGRLILYVMDKIRLVLNESLVSVLPTFSRNNKLIKLCSIQKEVINPLNVIAVESHMHQSNQLSDEKTRSKRSMIDDKVITYVDSHNDSNIIDSLSQNENVNSVSSRDRSTVLDCNMTSNKLGRVVCSEVICKLDVLPMNSVFNFDFRTWVFTKTFFEAKLADIIITTSLESNLGDLPRGVQKVDGENVVGPFTVSHNVLFSKMVVRADKPLPLWPIILAIIVGIILLVIIIIIAYYCGFFKRKRIKEELKKKRENKRLKNQQEDQYPLNST